MSGVLGVQTASYLPYCFFNLLSPVLDVLYGFIGLKVPSAAAPSAGGPDAAAAGESRRPIPEPGSGTSAG
jgi:NhaC family Na+:H+ antiporter